MQTVPSGCNLDFHLESQWPLVHLQELTCTLTFEFLSIRKEISFQGQSHQQLAARCVEWKVNHGLCQPHKPKELILSTSKERDEI